jgi:hypothetical protein
MTDNQKYDWHTNQKWFWYSRYKRTMTDAGLANMPAAYRVKHAPLKAKRLTRLIQHHHRLAYQYAELS